MKNLDEFMTETSERRRGRRRTSQARVRVSVRAQEIEGQAANISRTGVLFFSQSDLRVEVEVTDESGHARRLAGRLVRAERMRGDMTGWAVEFDPS